MMLEKIGIEWVKKYAKKDRNCPDIYKYKKLYFYITTKGKIEILFENKKKEIPF